MADILKLISETEAWRIFHKKRGYHIEAAACSIRLKALRDALSCLPPRDRSLAKAKEADHD